MLTGTLAKANEISDWKTGIFTIWSVGIKIAKITKSNPKLETKVSIALLENLAPKEPPVKRPMNIKNQ